MTTYEKMTKERFAEIATTALYEVLEAADSYYLQELMKELDLSREEAEFFGIEDYMDDEEEDDE